MPKNLLQDMVKVKRANREMRAPSSNEIHVERAPDPIQNVVYEVRDKKTGKTRYTLWIVAVVSLVFFLFAISYLFSKATITINPKIKDVVLNENLSASKNGGTDVLPFDLIVLSGEEDQTIQTTEERDVSKSAQGSVVIYNTFSSASQLLSIDTRLEGSNGKIYKTVKQIVVPGMKGGIPGSVEVGIYGAVGGEEYNSAPLDFKIFGFKGTPKYSKFYGRSKGPIAGGFKGKSPFISDADKASTLGNMKVALQAKLFKKATDQIPSGFVLFKDAVFLDTDGGTTDITPDQDNSLSAKLTGTLYGILFNEEKLTQKIATDVIDGYDSSPVSISHLSDLTFSLTSKDAVSFDNLANINFNLSGSTTIIWKVDESSLMNDLLGKSKKDFNQVLLQYPNIDSANLVLSPFWRASVPSKSKDIKITVNYPK